MRERERERDQRSEIVKLKCNEQKPDTRDGRKTMQKRALRTTTTTTTRNNRRQWWCERIPFETWWESLEISFLCALMKVNKMRGNERKSVFASFFFDYFFHYTRWSKKDSDEWSELWSSSYLPLHFNEEAKDVPSLAGTAALSTAWTAKCLLV